MYVFPIIQHHKGLERQWVMFMSLKDKTFKDTGRVNGNIVNCSKNNLIHDNYLFFLILSDGVMFDVLPDDGLEGSPVYWRIMNRFITINSSYEGHEFVVSAFQKARSARFEFAR